MGCARSHVAGEKLFVNYSGHAMEVIDGLSGEVRSMQIFVALLGASNYTYAEASQPACRTGDAACARALLLNARSYNPVAASRCSEIRAHDPAKRAAILKNGTDRCAPPAEEAPILFHANIRGRSY